MPGAQEGLSETYPQHFESACQRALRRIGIGYGILENNLDQQVEQPYVLNFMPDHANIRGGRNPTTINQYLIVN